MELLKSSFYWQGLLDQEVFEKYPKLRIVMNTIGNTEVIKIQSQVNSNVTILAKAEFQNLYFGASLGTGGTFNGISTALKYNGFLPRLFLTCPAELPYGSSEPPNGHPKFAGSGGLGLGIKQRFIEVIEDYIDLHFNITFEEANNTALKFFQEYNIPIGSSAGANYFAAEKIASTIDAGTIITVFPSLMPKS